MVIIRASVAETVPYLACSRTEQERAAPTNHYIRARGHGAAKRPGDNARPRRAGGTPAFWIGGTRDPSNGTAGRGPHAGPGARNGHGCSSPGAAQSSAGADEDKLYLYLDLDGQTRVHARHHCGRCRIAGSTGYSYAGARTWRWPVSRLPRGYADESACRASS